MKARKPKVGSIPEKMEKAGAVRRLMKRECERHDNKAAGIVAQRAVLQGVADPALRAAKMAKLAHDDIEERQRHAAKMRDLERRLREVWR